MGILRSLFPSRNDRLLKTYFKRAETVTALEGEMQSLDDADLRARFDACRERVRSGTPVDDVLAESFAITREVCDRRLGIWNLFNPEHGYDWSKAKPAVEQGIALCREAQAADRMPHECLLPATFYQAVREEFPESRPPFRMQSFPVQLAGGIVLHEGKIAEMRTGEGKTLTSVNAVVLNALAGQVFVVTVNDYLARRDAAWMAPAYLFLGLSCGALQSQMPPWSRKEVYDCDIVYGTNSEFGFDYLRDNMAGSLEDQVQKERRYAIVDEVDSVLIDEARTPLIISGRPEEGRTPYQTANEIAAQLTRDTHFTVEEKHKQASLTEDGVARCEELLGIDNMYSGRNIEWPHLIENAVRAHALYENEKDYIVGEDEESGRREVIIVDEFTGRLQHGRRWGDGLHQAVEAKEGLDTREESITLATVTIQNFFRMFDRLAGMTGTAYTEAMEFHQIYGLDVVVMPTHRPMIRQDEADVIYGNYDAKCKAIVNDVAEMNQQGRPVLVGTTSVAKSEDLSKRLKKKGVPHNVLNAKNHAKEAEIVAGAGQPGAVTIATNMAGRGTDIALGAGVRDMGGLHIIGTERHESRRIDNQLRGRAGRQGDPGSSRFYLCIEDDLMRIFANDWVRSMMQKGLDGDERIESKLVSRSIERAQKKVEEHNFGIRKSLIEYDDVKNDQRKLIYAERQSILEREELSKIALNLVEDDLAGEAEACMGRELRAVDRDPQPFLDHCTNVLGLDVSGLGPEQLVDSDTAVEAVVGIYRQRFDALADEIGRELYEEQIAQLMLYKLDVKWKDHLSEMDRLRSSIGLMGYAQMDPKIAYKKEGFEIFDQMLAAWARDVSSLMLRIEPPQEEEDEPEVEILPALGEMVAGESGPADTAASVTPPASRNAPCPCGSGRKYKNCHGKEG